MNSELFALVVVMLVVETNGQRNREYETNRQRNREYNEQNHGFCFDKTSKKRYPANSAFAEGCRQCQCPAGGGNLICTIFKCPEVKCLNPEYSDAICCPWCPSNTVPTCKYYKELFEVGHIIMNDADCTALLCPDDGGSMVETNYCPMLYCNFRDTPLDSCCPVCAKDQSPKHYCTYNGKLYMPTQQFKDECRECKCDIDGGQVICREKPKCPDYNCQNPLVEASSCCLYCPLGW